MKPMINHKKGQSLIEAIVAIAVVVVLVTGLVVGTTRAISATTSARVRSVANKLVQDGMEYLRQQRNIVTWSEFSDYAGNTYCMKDDNTLVPGATCSASDQIVQSAIPPLSRIAQFTSSGVNKIDVTIMVSWSESGTTRQSKATTSLTNWNK
jgi:Tfp pilus assembly protein PilV